MRTTVKILLLVALCCAIFGTALAGVRAPWVSPAGVALAWTRCVTVHATATTRCQTFPIQGRRHAYGVTRTCDRTPVLTICRTVPRLTPPYQTLWLWVTGYSYGAACGDVTGMTADRTPVAVGAIASDNPALWHRRIVVPSLGYDGVVRDRGNGGSGIDLFAPSCRAAYTYTGYRETHVYPAAP